MKDRKEYYRNYTKKCKFVNLRFNLDIEEERIIYNTLINHANIWRISKSDLIKVLLEKYL